MEKGMKRRGKNERKINEKKGKKGKNIIHFWGAF